MSIMFSCSCQKLIRCLWSVQLFTKPKKSLKNHRLQYLLNLSSNHYECLQFLRSLYELYMLAAYSLKTFDERRQLHFISKFICISSVLYSCSMNGTSGVLSGLCVHDMINSGARKLSSTCHETQTTFRLGKEWVLCFNSSISG